MNIKYTFKELTDGSGRTMQCVCILDSEGNEVLVSINDFLEQIKDQTDKLTFDVSNNLKVNIAEGDISIDEVGIKNVSDFRINPSTEETVEATRVLTNDLKILLTSLNGKDYSTEETLEAIRVLVVGIEEIVTTISNIDFATESKQDLIIDNLLAYGNTPNRYSITGSTTSTLLIDANIERKQVTITNDTNRELSISYVSPATLNEAIVLDREEVLIETRYRGAIYGIWTSGVIGNAEIIEVSK